MDNNDSRAWSKGSSSSTPQQHNPPPTGSQQQPPQQRGLPPPAGANTAQQQPRYAGSPQNQLAPIQRPMSPKADTAASRPYMPPISHSGAPVGAAAGGAANSAAAGGGGIAATAQVPRPTAPYNAGGSLPPPQTLGQSPAMASASGGATGAGAAASLPPISNTYARSPSFTSTQASAIPGMKSTPGAQSLPHPASSPIHGSAAPANSSAYASGSQSQVQSGARISTPAGGIVSPSARAPSSAQMPLPQQASSVPPGKQMQSPMVQRTASVQNSPIPPMVQASPRAPAMSTPQASSGATFSVASRQPSSTAAASAVSTNTGNGPAAAATRVAPSVSAPSGNASIAAAQPQSAAATANPQLSVSTQAIAPAAATATSGNAEGTQATSGAAADAAGRPLNVRDALSYLDMVKSQFQDRPEVYNQFLDIMKDFKSHTIDTPGVIERVSRLFYGSPALIQGFNTFLPPGYRIDVSDDPNEGVRVTTPSGSVLPDMHRRQPTAQPQSPLAASHSQSHQYGAQRGPSREQYLSRQGSASASGATQQHAHPQTNLAAYGGSGAAVSGNGAQAAAAARAPSQVASPSMGASVHHPRQAPMEFNHAINYVNKIKMRFAAEPDHYKEFLEILQTYQKESRPIQEVYSQVQVLFASAPDLLDEFKQFLPDTSESGGPGAGGGMIGGHGSAASPAAGHARSGSSLLQGQQGVAGRAGGDAVASSRLPPVGNFTPTGAVGHVVDPYAQAGGVASSATAGGAAASGTGRKRRNVMGSGNAQVPGATASKRRNKGSKHESNALPVPMGDAAAAGLYGQAMPDAAMIQMPQNPATATSDELVFFERVKRFIGQPATYNEFLKLLNMYNQEVLDAKGLMDRAASFIGDDRELMAWFKQFVGYDERQQSVEDSRSSDEAIMESLLGPEPQAYLTPEDAAKTLRPVRQKADLTNCKSYGPSYRLLPPSATQAKCSGRDAMCYEVLNDKWASHPTWASEDTDFMHHKKNCYEDGLFRTEEDRHEMDIEIDTNLSVIRQLTPIAQQIEKMDPEQAMQLTLPENFWGMSEALPRRALRKVYDSHRALEIIKAMHTHPSVAIPIVLKRLKQKDEEWRRQRRECSKAWRESDAKNFYKALDHQGLTFKSTDRKNISPKHLVQEIETRRREQQNLADEGGARAQSRKVASALRHRYQLEYKFTEPTVIADVINAILAHVGKPNSQFVASEKESMEKLFQELFDGLLGVEKSADDSSAEKQQQQQNPSSAVTNGVSSPSPSPGADSGKANGKGGDKGSDSDGVAMDVDGAKEEGKPQQASEEGGSKPSTPGLISSRSWIQLGTNGKRSAAAEAEAEAAKQASGSKSVSRAFYTNSNYYVFLRLFQILYDRFNVLREIGPECQKKAQYEQQMASAASKLGMRPQPSALKAFDLQTTDYYTVFLDLVDQYLQGQLETNQFDEAMRVMYNTSAYRILTVDKVVQAIAKNMQHLISDSKCVDILELFTTLPAVHEQSPLRSHIAYRMKVETLVGADDHVFRVDYIYDARTMTIQLLRREDITLDEAVTEEERWAYYVDSYVLFEPTEGVPRLQQARARPYLPRHLHADEREYVVSSRSNLEIKIAVNTYKLCFLTGTEDIYINHTRRAVLADDAAKGAYAEQWAGRTERWESWVAREHEASGAELVEWWK